LGRVSQNEYFQSRVLGDFLLIMVGYFMSMMLKETGWNFTCCKKWELQQLQEVLHNDYFSQKVQLTSVR
jgi:hypothetical protein